MRSFLNSAFRRAQNLSRPVRILLTLGAGVVVVGLIFWILDKVILYSLTRSYVDSISSAFALNKHMADAILWVTFGIGVLIFRLIFSFSRTKRLVGALGILALLVGHSLALWY